MPAEFHIVDPISLLYTAEQFKHVLHYRLNDNMMVCRLAVFFFFFCFFFFFFLFVFCLIFVFLFVFCYFFLFFFFFFCFCFFFFSVVFPLGE